MTKNRNKNLNPNNKKRIHIADDDLVNMDKNQSLELYKQLTENMTDEEIDKIRKSKLQKNFADQVFMRHNRFVELVSLGQRLNECLLAINEYSNIPTESDVTLSMINFMQSIKTGDTLEIVHTVYKPFLNNLVDLSSIEAIILYVGNAIDASNIYNNKSLGYLGSACIALSKCWTDELENGMIDSHKGVCTFLQNILFRKGSETLGYWTAKLEEMKRNKEHGAKAMEDKGDKNKEAIKNIMREQNIISMDFRGKKVEREKFYETAKQRTKEIDTKNRQALTEARIQKIGREILKEDKPVS